MAFSPVKTGDKSFVLLLDAAKEDRSMPATADRADLADGAGGLAATALRFLLLPFLLIGELMAWIATTAGRIAAAQEEAVPAAPVIPHVRAAALIAGRIEPDGMARVRLDALRRRARTMVAATADDPEARVAAQGVLDAFARLADAFAAAWDVADDQDRSVLSARLARGLTTLDEDLAVAIGTGPRDRFDTVARYVERRHGIDDMGLTAV